ncbi:hypothetical protein HPB50_003833 [Hyalomma asiaticum]|uniref:Uncharacterized protein n=1 Tax=Hyalomma asiaticum TaxID=266040 RepID=A0ACB7TC72_HYAAI|nr:hypothetical protein HPB50_003833 [Hyalomma asiaticum]
MTYTRSGHEHSRVSLGRQQRGAAHATCDEDISLWVAPLTTPSGRGQRGFGGPLPPPPPLPFGPRPGARDVSALRQQPAPRIWAVRPWRESLAAFWVSGLPQPWPRCGERSTSPAGAPLLQHGAPPAPAAYFGSPGPAPKGPEGNERGATHAPSSTLFTCYAQSPFSQR